MVDWSGEIDECRLAPGAFARDEPDRRSTETPLLARADYAAPSVFRPENMLREARRQKGILGGSVPRVCLLDPDGDMVRYIKRLPTARKAEAWACYHTKMWEWGDPSMRFGIVGSAVGGAFAVLVAEQLFASGCELLISISSAGRIAGDFAAPCHILLERALRDEGTSHHYLPPSAYVAADPALGDLAMQSFTAAGCVVQRGDTWTTDAPFRETAAVISARRRAGILTVEMEAASLYAFAVACSRPVLCLAHVTNELGCIEGDFDKGEHDGACASLRLFRAVAEAWLHARDRAERGQSAG